MIFVNAHSFHASIFPLQIDFFNVLSIHSWRILGNPWAKILWKWLWFYAKNHILKNFIMIYEFLHQKLTIEEKKRRVRGGASRKTLHFWGIQKVILRYLKFIDNHDIQKEG